jgi:hypothetical protein
MRHLEREARFGGSGGFMYYRFEYVPTLSLYFVIGKVGLRGFREAGFRGFGGCIYNRCVIYLVWVVFSPCIRYLMLCHHIYFWQ